MTLVGRSRFAVGRGERACREGPLMTRSRFAAGRGEQACREGALIQSRISMVSRWPSRRRRMIHRTSWMAGISLA